MADRRKLYGEIERCLKKVTEGVEAFEDIWKKVYSATNTNQKEKYEADLKKEIKKLQRLRDQIKTWMTSSDIKDKRDLQNARKLIETQMERFKIVERETKTKAYSKEGLGAAQKLDPAQKERDEMTTWLTACLECLNIQVDKFESEMDAINFALKKKKNDKEKVDRSEDLKKRTEKHKYHIKQLEALLRMLDNGTVAVDQIRKIQEDVEYYRDCSQEDDFQENEFIYDDFDLQDLEDYLAKQQNESETKTAEEDSSQSQSTTGTHSPSPSFENHTCDREPESVDSTTSRNSPSPPNVICDPPVLHNCQPVINSPPPSPSTLTVSPSIQPIAATEPEVNNHDHVWTDANCNHVDFNLSSSKPVIFDDAQSSLKTLAEKVVLNSNHLLHLPTLHNSSEPIFLSKGGSAEIDISQIFGSQNKYSDGQKRALAILEAAHNTLPLTTDSQRFRYLSPGGPAKTPDYYPSNAPNSNSIDFFTRLSTETLFFIFYFLQGTKAQYLAARALKTKSWRFHTMFMMWFQRHEEPKAITDDFEQGTYVYFDYEKWMQRKKEGFIFEYKYLEDKDLN